MRDESQLDAMPKVFPLYNFVVLCVVCFLGNIAISSTWCVPCNPTRVSTHAASMVPVSLTQTQSGCQHYLF